MALSKKTTKALQNTFSSHKKRLERETLMHCSMHFSLPTSCLSDHIKFKSPRLISSFNFFLVSPMLLIFSWISKSSSSCYFFLFSLSLPTFALIASVTGLKILASVKNFPIYFGFIFSCSTCMDSKIGSFNFVNDEFYISKFGINASALYLSVSKWLDSSAPLYDLISDSSSLIWVFDNT